eukprot:scaffold324447_cov61-Tisochrysis_lutea.AAC.4
MSLCLEKRNVAANGLVRARRNATKKPSWAPLQRPHPVQTGLHTSPHSDRAHAADRKEWVGLGDNGHVELKSGMLRRVGESMGGLRRTERVGNGCAHRGLSHQ